MGIKTKKVGWRKLDNTGKIFPVIANEHLSNVFRLSVTLKEPIEIELLQQALENILPYLPNFRVKIRRGVFWYYFEDNLKIPKVTRERTYPCKFIDPHGSSRFLFRVTYYENNINFEVFHALTDGLGAVNFLRELTCQYLYLKKGNTGYWKDETQIITLPSVAQLEDSYLKNYKKVNHKEYTSNQACRLTGSYLGFGTGQVLHGYLPLEELKAVSKKYDVSITKYLAAAMIWCIWKEYQDGEISKQAVVLNLPINLRAFFGSSTMSNFFAVSMIGYLFQDPQMEFQTLVKIISKQMDRKITKEKMEEAISYNVSNEKKWYIRITPLFVKWLVLNGIFKIKDGAYSMTISNIGPISVEPEYAQDIERFRLMIGVSRRQPIKCAICAYGDEVVVTFSSVFSDSNLQKRFFKLLKQEGVTINLEGNELAACKHKRSYPRIRKIFVLRKHNDKKAIKQAGKQAVHVTADYISGKKNLKEELEKRFHW